MLSVGEILRKAREKKGLTIKQAEKETKIRAKYLDAVERNDWSIFASKVYISGVIKNYALYLDLDPQKTIAYFRRDYEKKEDLKFKKRIHPSLLPETRKIVFAIFGLIFLVFFIYFGYQLNIYLKPPEVAIVSPQKNIFRNTERINVIGKTEREAHITIFNERVYPDKDGVFEYDLPLKKGKNYVTIEVIGANGEKTVVTEEYILE